MKRLSPELQEAFALISDVRKIAKRLRLLDPQLKRSATDLDCIQHEIEDAMIERMNPQTVDDVRAMPNCLQIPALLWLIGKLDNTIEVGDYDDPESFCTDWYETVLDDRTVAREVLADKSLVDAWDVVEWLCVREGVERPCKPFTYVLTGLHQREAL